ncbi:hypothetical protein RHMOL_Rhmol02G0274700 [Rhododendron molle]|nr:hypothetical protein RHMOL_Rhmol02G0274700 [Rhododendron molle]
MFDKNVDAGVEFSGLEDHSWPHDYEYVAAVEGLTNVDRDSDVVSCDELRSPCNSDDEEGLGAQSKHTIFNENTDMINPVFEPNMEFKTHALVRDAVKEYGVCRPDFLSVIGRRSGLNAKRVVLGNFMLLM